MPRTYNQLEYNELRRKLRNDRSAAEVVLWRHLQRSQLLGYKFRRQHGIGPYVVDFYCPNLRLAVEIDGDTHFAPNQINHDRRRQQWIERLGITVVRFQNDEVLASTDYVLEKLKTMVRNLADHP